MKIDNLKYLIASIGFILITLSCNNESLPKPSAFLRLEYPTAQYKKTKSKYPFSFFKNKIAEVKHIPKSSEGINIDYPKLKATIYITYKSLKNNTLDSLLLDAQNLTQKHTIKADAISQIVYENPNSKVYGMLYEVEGNAASQTQFYVTDSTHHFVSGALYFYAKPNFDSIYPAVIYLKKDIKTLMESIEWVN